MVASGAPYTVTAVNGRVPGSLDDFGDGGVEVVVSRAVTIRGTGRRTDAQTAVVHEKTLDGGGKDLRTWAITMNGTRFEATERSMF